VAVSRNAPLELLFPIASISGIAAALGAISHLLQRDRCPKRTKYSLGNGARGRPSLLASY